MTINRFLEIVRELDAGADACWEWRMATLRGYGRGILGSGSDVRWFYAHRLAYELLVGPIPAGMQLDHLCRNRACVNPAHLEPVTNRVNVLRGVGPTAINATKQQCKNGHEYTHENTAIYWRTERNGAVTRMRICRECARATKRRSYARHGRRKTA